MSHCDHSCTYKITNLGCICHCDEIELPLTAPWTGQFFVQYKFLNSLVRKKISLYKGENFILSGEWFNETAMVDFALTDLDGNSLTPPVACVETDCNEFFQSSDCENIPFIWRMKLNPCFTQEEPCDITNLFSCEDNCETNNCTLI